MIVLKWLLISLGALFLVILLTIFTLPIWLPTAVRLLAKFFLTKHFRKTSSAVAEEVVITADGFLRQSVGIPKKNSTPQTSRYRDDQITDATIIE